MRYFLLLFGLCVVAVMVILGQRGDHFRKTPLEIFPDMDRQPKYRPQQPSTFFANQRTSQEPVPGTVARGDRFENNPVNTGRLPGPPTTTNYVATIPIPVTEQLMLRGQQRYNIYCLPCHGPVGNANGIVKKYGMAAVKSLHDKLVVIQDDGQIFDTIANGRLTMMPYGSQINVEDRWAIVAYVRALQRSRLSFTNEVPAQIQAGLK